MTASFHSLKAQNVYRFLSHGHSKWQGTLISSSGHLSDDDDVLGPKNEAEAIERHKKKSDTHIESAIFTNKYH